MVFMCVTLDRPDVCMFVSKKLFYRILLGVWAVWIYRLVLGCHTIIPQVWGCVDLDPIDIP